MIHSEELFKLVSHINGIDITYINAILSDISDGLEMISGLPNNRIYLESPSRYGSKKLILEPFHLRGYPLSLKTTFIAISDGHLDLRQSLQDTYEAKVYISSKPEMAMDYAESDMKGSTYLGKAHNIASSLILPIIINNSSIGVVAVDSVKHLDQKTFSSLKDIIADFLGLVAKKLSDVLDYWSPIIQEKRAEDAMKAHKTSLILDLPIQEGNADMALLMVPDLVTINYKTERHIVPFSLVSRDETDKKIFFGLLRDNGYNGRMTLCHESFILTTEIMEKIHDKIKVRHETSNTPSFFRLRDTACSFEIDLEKKTGLVAAIFYPVVDRQKNLIYAIIFYLKKEAARRTKAIISNTKGQSLLNYEMKSLESKINSVLYGLSASTLIADHLITIYQINQNYEDYNKMKDIRKGLSEFLHSILYNILVISGADCGTIGVVGAINGKKYVIVEQEGGIVVGAKAGDIHNRYIRSVRIGTPVDLLTKELSLSGMAAAECKTMATHGTEGIDTDGQMPCPDVTSAIAVPIVVEKETIAVLTLASRENYFLSEKKEKLLEMIAEIVGTNVHKLIMKYKVSIEVIKLYGNRYPYIKNDALHYLAELNNSHFIDLSRFLDSVLKNYKSRRRDKKDKEHNITMKDIKTTYLDSSLERINLEEYLEKTDNDVANYIYLMLTTRKTNFYDAVQAAYSKHEISRNVAVLVYEKAKLALSNPLLTRIAVSLNVCSENYKGSYEEKKKIERFRQFYKKTIGIQI